MSKVYISLGSNLGNRFENLRLALKKLSEVLTITDKSIVFETEAILPDGAPIYWKLPYFNMVVVGDSDLSPHQLLVNTQQIERQMGRQPQHLKWEPRIIDIDLLIYDSLIVNDEYLKIPHPAIATRPFLRNLLNFVGHSAEYSEYYPLNSYVLDPKIIGIVNVTPDSFSDGGDYFSSEKAIHAINHNLKHGAYIAELGAQSTRPGYIEVSPSEEIHRLSMVLDLYDKPQYLGVDTYFDSVVEYCLGKGVKWINDIKGELSDATIKKIADSGSSLVIMLVGMDVMWLKNKISYLTNLGMPKDRIILDPGLGFGKKKYENLLILKKLSQIKEMGCEILLGHSRKSFLRLFSSTSIPAKELDPETLSLSLLADVDYLRVHNVRDNMKALVAKNVLNR